jgi:hypothetical protein
MQVVWEFHHNNHVWLEWIENGKTRLKRFTEEAFKLFMSINKVDVKQEVSTVNDVEDDMEFLN